MDIILSFLAKSVDKHSITPVQITYPPLFFDVRKAFDTIWINGLLYKLYHELDINSKQWLIIKELYTSVHACVTYNGFLSRDFVISQGSRQGLAPFMYKVYINKLLKDLCTPGIGILLLNYNLSAPTFADGMTLSALYPSCLNVLISVAYTVCISALL